MSHAQSSPAELADVRFAVVDVETSGLSTRHDRVLQVAVVTVDGVGNVLDTWVSLVRPRMPWLFRLGPRRIHGLSRSALRSAPPAQAVFTELAKRLKGATFTAHNARFDASFLRQGARRAAIELPLTPVLCTLKLSRRLDTERALSHRLADICQRYGIPLDRPHDALEDAVATAAVLSHLLREYGVTSADQLARLTTA